VAAFAVVVLVAGLAVAEGYGTAAAVHPAVAGTGSPPMLPQGRLDKPVVEGLRTRLTAVDIGLQRRTLDQHHPLTRGRTIADADAFDLVLAAVDIAVAVAVATAVAAADVPELGHHQTGS